MYANIHYATIPLGMYLADSVIPLLRPRNFLSLAKFVRCAFSPKSLIRMGTTLWESALPVKAPGGPPVDRFARLLRRPIAHGGRP